MYVRSIYVLWPLSRWDVVSEQKYFSKRPLITIYPEYAKKVLIFWDSTETFFFAVYR